MHFNINWYWLDFGPYRPTNSGFISHFPKYLGQTSAFTECLPKILCTRDFMNKERT